MTKQRAAGIACVESTQPSLNIAYCVLRPLCLCALWCGLFHNQPPCFVTCCDMLRCAVCCVLCPLQLQLPTPTTRRPRVDLKRPDILLRDLVLWFASRDVHLSATFSRNFYWTEINMWPDDLPAGWLVGAVGWVGLVGMVVLLWGIKFVFVFECSELPVLASAFQFSDSRLFGLYRSNHQRTHRHAVLSTAPNNSVPAATHYL